jgi:hypothetical protein
MDKNMPHGSHSVAISNSLSLYAWFVQEILKNVDFMCLCPVVNTRYLGQCIIYDWAKKIIWVLQSDLIITLVEDWGMLECKTSLVPFPFNLNKLPPCSPNACSD